MMADDLQDQLEAAGIPLVGLSMAARMPGEHPHSPRAVRVDYKSSATVQHMAQAEAIIAAFDWRPRKTRAMDALLVDIKALTGNQQRDLQLAMMASYLRDHPRLARKLGIPLDGDEPDGE